MAHTMAPASEWIPWALLTASITWLRMSLGTTMKMISFSAWRVVMPRDWAKLSSPVQRARMMVQFLFLYRCFLFSNLSY